MGSDGKVSVDREHLERWAHGVGVESLTARMATQDEIRALLAPQPEGDEWDKAAEETCYKGCSGQPFQRYRDHVAQTFRAVAQRQQEALREELERIRADRMRYMEKVLKARAENEKLKEETADLPRELCRCGHPVAYFNFDEHDHECPVCRLKKQLEGSRAEFRTLAESMRTDGLLDENGNPTGLVARLRRRVDGLDWSKIGAAVLSGYHKNFRNRTGKIVNVHNYEWAAAGEDARTEYESQLAGARVQSSATEDGAPDAAPAEKPAASLTKAEPQLTHDGNATFGTGESNEPAAFPDGKSEAAFSDSAESLAEGVRAYDALHHAAGQVHENCNGYFHAGTAEWDVLNDLDAVLQAMPEPEEFTRALTEYGKAKDKRIAELERGTAICSYCGEEFGGTRSEQATRALKHMESCPRHPLGIALKRIAELENGPSRHELDARIDALMNENAQLRAATPLDVLDLFEKWQEKFRDTFDDDESIVGDMARFSIPAARARAEAVQRVVELGRPVLHLWKAVRAGIAKLDVRIPEGTGRNMDWLMPVAIKKFDAAVKALDEEGNDENLG